MIKVFLNEGNHELKITMEVLMLVIKNHLKWVIGFLVISMLCFADDEVLHTSKHRHMNPVLLECEMDVSSATECSLCTLKHNKIFGFGLFDSASAQEDAESVCNSMEKNCENLSCSEVEGEVSNRLSLKCDCGYMGNNGSNHIDVIDDLETVNSNISGVLNFAKDACKQELESRKLNVDSESIIISGCVLATIGWMSNGNIDNWRWLNE